MSKSENGWEPLHAGEDILNWIDVPGTNPTVRLRLMKGWPTQILRAFAADFNAHVEPLRDGDSAGFTATNSVATSNHLNGTAMDLNWNGEDNKTFRYGISKERAYPGDKARKLDELIDFYERTVFCGGEWSIRDWMHMQMGGNTWMNPKTQDFINRKIRADGFSTFKRGGTPAPAPPRPTGMTVPLTPLANGRWTSPSPAWAHLITRESGGNPTIIQQIHDVNSGGNEAEGLFQITPRTWRGANGTEFAPSARSATPQQQAIVAARIFTRNPSGSDWGAGLPGREDPKQLAAGLVPITAPPPSGEEELSAEAERKINEMYDLVCGQRKSESLLRPLGQGNIGNLRDVIGYLDGTVNWVAVRMAAHLGHPKYVQLLHDLAEADLTKYPDRAEGKQLAQAILNEMDSFAGTCPTPPAAAPLAAVEPQVVYVPTPLPEVSHEPKHAATTVGELLGRAYDALEDLRAALPEENQATLAALSAGLNKEIGSQL